MTLTELERLVRRIGEVLQGRLLESQAAGLAQDYADACRKAQHRLEQCVSMVARGEEAQALQLAEAPPPLMDVISRLGFRQVDAWREYCQSHRLPVADSIDPVFIGKLGAVYSKGVAPDHELYRRYREAVLARQDERALAVLRAILRANPADPTADKELERLEQKILNHELGKLSSALEARDDFRVIAIIQEIEFLGLAVQPQGEVWKNAQIARCRVLLRQGSDDRTRKDWSAASQTLALFQAVLEEHKLSLPQELSDAFAELEAWARECQKADDEENRFKRGLGELKKLVASGEDAIGRGLPLGRAELRQILQNLDHQFRALELHQRSLDPDLVARMQRISQVFRGQLLRKEQRSRTLLFAAVAGGVILSLFLSFFLWKKRAARDFALELRTFREHRRVVSAEKLASEVRTSHSALVSILPELKNELQEQDRFLQAERQKEKETAELIKGMVAAEFARLDPRQIQARLTAIDQAIEAAAEDFRPELRSQLKPILIRWNGWIEQKRQEQNQQFARELRAVEAPVRALAYGSGVAGVRSLLAQITPRMTALETLSGAPLPQLEISPELRSSFQALAGSVRGFSNELARWDQMQGIWARPGSWTDYLASLTLLQHSEFVPPADKAPAAELLGLNLNQSTLLRGLLLPDDPEAWNAFERGAPVNFKPDEVMPGERVIFNRLRDDENILNISTCKIIRLRDAPPDTPKSYTGFVRGQLSKNKFGRKHGVVYDPYGSPNLLDFKERQFDEYAYAVEEGGRSPEGELFERVGMKNLIDSRNASSYASSILTILDALNREDGASPLFRAYLAVRLHDMLELRPASWDAHWAPNLKVDRKRLRELGADEIVSGDWMLPFRHGALSHRLEEHFLTARKVLYRQQARFLSTLARRAIETGFGLAGHVDGAGHPALASATEGVVEFWGWASGTRAPALLFKRRAGAEMTVVREPMLFSPLLKFQKDRARLIAETRTGVTTTPAELGSYLPPLFAPPYE